MADKRTVRIQLGEGCSCLGCLFLMFLMASTVVGAWTILTWIF